MKNDIDTTQIANALTIDVEDYFQVAALAEAVRREGWDSMEYRVEANTRRLLELLERHNTRATFFTLGFWGMRLFTIHKNEVARVISTKPITELSVNNQCIFSTSMRVLWHATTTTHKNKVSNTLIT